MIKEITLRVQPKTSSMELALIGEVSAKLGIDANRIKHLQVMRRSIDARQRQVMVNLTLQAYIDEEYHPEPVAWTKPELVAADAPQAVVVGMGPAGLFAALELLKHGIKPVVLERGKDVDHRRLDLAKISKEGKVDDDSNYCFGEGGAGAFSDGKLFTRSKKRGNVDEILQILHVHGADEKILVDAHPHIGTDRLPGIIKAIRQTIIEAGGVVKFDVRVSGLIREGNEVVGVKTRNGETFAGPVILATGHSARDVYRFLDEQEIPVMAKGLAIGVRVEHPQGLIDRIRYHNPNGRGNYLPPAEYTLLTRVDGRGVYSFCMCPGGVIVPATSHDGELVVNGMSSSARGSQWANSGMVVEVLPEDVEGDSPLKMMDYQESIERRFFDDSHSLNAPAQRLKDFVEGKPSSNLPRTSYAPGAHPGMLSDLLPDAISSRLRKGIEEFGKKQRGFVTNNAMAIGCETRTSAPVKIPRDPETYCHVSVPGLYPAGEGAGQAGGIVSAAIDGQNVAAHLAKSLGK